MSETKFTKGPWSNSGRAIGVISDSDDQSNGMMLSICWIDKFDFADQCEANSALIACAPEMYEMLDEISDGLLDAGGYGNCALAKRIEQLLAKARGEK